MIDIRLTSACARKLARELKRAGTNEIGGVLAAEQVDDGDFVIRALSVQRDGSFASFKRDPIQHRKFMRRFAIRTNENYERFNYLGEWHSHPSFAALPSRPDLSQMQRLVEEDEQTASFLILLVVKLGTQRGRLIGSAHAFRPGLEPLRVKLSATGALLDEASSTVKVAASWRHQFDKGSNRHDSHR